MLTCKDLGLEWFTLRMFRLTSSSTWASLTSVVPFIPVNHDVRPAVENVAYYCGLEGRLVDDDDDDDAGDLNNTEMESQIDSETVAWIVKSMRSPTQSTANECAEAARRIKDALGSDNISSPVIEKMMLELGFSRERASCEGNLNEGDRAKKLKKFLDSVIRMEAEVHFGDSDSETDSSAEVLNYDFPYDILSANEVQTELIRRVGNAAYLSGEVPGPHSKPTRVAERRATLLFLDKNPVDRVDGQNVDSSNLNNLCAAITDGIIKRSFLRGLEGEEKGAAKVGHQNEPKYLAQYFNDGCNGLVPGVDALIDIYQPGLAVQEGRPYVGDSADGIAIERHPDDDDDDDDYRSHLIECKCRVGPDKLREASEIRNRVAEIKGGMARLDVEQNKAVYLEVSSGSPILSEVIPSTKERVQVLHHAFTYKHDRTTLLVGDPQGNIMYGLIITFDSELLEDYGKVLDFMYENGLDKFYSNDLDELPKKFIEDVLETDTTLKRKYDMDDFMTSFLIWRELRLDGPNPPNFPIPQCDLLILLSHSLWNASKGGSDTITRLAWNCLVILAIKTPQTVVVGRLFMLYAALLHRMNQAITGRKKPDVTTDTIKSVRDRNNKRFAFHESLRSVKDLFKKCANGRNAEETVDSASEAGSRPTRVPAARLTASNASTRHDINDSALERVGTTGATPFGRGKSKRSSQNLPGFSEYKHRCDNCLGVPIKIMDLKTDDKGEPSGFQLSKRKCDLCGMRTTTMCMGCKRVFCLDNDRTAKVRELLKDEEEGARIRRDFPALADLRRGDAPSSVCRVGVINNDPIYAVQSCFHYARPNYFEQCKPAVVPEASLSTPPRRRL